MKSVLKKLVYPCLILTVLCSGNGFIFSNHADPVWVIKNGRIIDGNGGKPIENGIIVIRGKRIAGIGKAGTITIPEKAKVLNVGGKTVMPV